MRINLHDPERREILNLHTGAIRDIRTSSHGSSKGLVMTAGMDKKLVLSTGGEMIVTR